MLGAVYGDIIGSYYEVHCTKNYNFDFMGESHFTDDTVMNAAVCKAILKNPITVNRWQVKKRGFEYAAQYKQFYAYYPNAGFGNMFSEWAREHGYSKNRSYANGGAMRVISIGYAYETEGQVLIQAKASCVYTHRHREAIKAAQAVALCVFYARKGCGKADIKSRIEKRFGYKLSRPLDEIRENHVFNSRASYSVPPAIIAFLESHDYESAVRNAVSFGGDADTEACIAGGIAEAFYREIPKHISDFCDKRIDGSLKQVFFEFKNKYSCDI